MKNTNNLHINQLLNPLRNINGFSLTEIAIVLLVTGIVAAIAVPNITSTLPNYRLKGAARDLYSTMQKAKLEAVKRNTDIGIAFTEATAANSGRYQVFVDDNGNKAQDAGEITLSQHSMPAGCNLISTNFPDEIVGFNSRGLPLNGVIGTVRLQNAPGRRYLVILSTSGHVRIVTDTNY